MSWIAQLVKTYDANAALAGKPAVDGSKAVLPPIGISFRMLKSK